MMSDAMYGTKETLMARFGKAWAVAGLLLAALSLAGCPPRPVLSVAPLAVNIAAQQNASEFQITNLGAGTLNWTASETLPWLSLSVVGTGGAPADAVQGTLTGGAAAVRVQVDRSALDTGTANGEVTITSNGGSATVRVSVITAGTATLDSSTDALNLGTSLQQGSFILTNGGTEQLGWSAVVAPGAPWLTIEPASGTLEDNTASDEVFVTVNRSGLAAGAYAGQVNVTSNGGNLAVTVNMIVSPFEVTPASLNFGTVATTSELPLALRNRSTGQTDLILSTSTNTGGAWLSAAAANVSLPGSAQQSVTITANAVGLAAGEYTGQVSVTQNGGSFSVVVPVTMNVSSFAVSDGLVDFGTIDAPASQTIQLTTLGGASVAWEASIPPAAQAWLSVSPAEGTVTGSQNIEITANPAALDAGDFEAVITLTHAGGSATVTVRLTRPEPASLTVAPADIDLGTTKLGELVGIWNPGTGTVNWTIDTTGFPAWLSLTPAPGGIASGSVAGDNTDAVNIAVDRALAPAGQTELEHTFNVQATGDFTGAVPVTVRARVPQIPRLVIESPVGQDGINFINLDTEEDSDTFIIRNEGNGLLTWNINLTGAPEWIASVQPSQGNLDPGTQQTVTITVDRSTLTYLGAQFQLFVTSNDPDRTAVPLQIEVLVPKRVAITTRPGSFAFGPTQTADTLEVANDGDPDTVMNFRLTTSKEWLSVFPDTGSSIGTASAIKDFRPFSITVDRSLIEGNGASGKIIITAYEVVDGEAVPLEDVPPFEVEVSVQAAQLTIETTARPYLRVPSVVRFPMMLRNVRYQILPLNQAILPQVAQQFLILENDVELELTETEQRLKAISLDGGIDDGVRLSGLIMLDYSGSMQESARSVDDPAISGAADPIQALYERCIPELLDSLPPNMDIGLAIFSDRDPVDQAPLRPLFGTAAEPLAQQDRVFISDREALKDRLRNVVVNDNGATQLFDAITAGVQELLYYDYDRNLYFSDFTDFPALICVTDGRITTPPSPINEYITLLQDFRIRFYPIGWGNEVSANPLVRLSTSSGGHFYSTRTIPTGAVDAFGVAERKPVVEELEDWCITDADECDQSLGRDFASLLTLSFVSLNEETNTSFQARLTFNDPNDQQGVCLPEQGLINGSATTLPANMSAVAADNRLGQVSLRSDGISGGNAVVTARMEYAPRNVSALSFSLTVEGADPISRDDVTIVSAPNSGIISDWTISGAGNVFTFTSPGGPLGYGDYGDLFAVNVTGAGTDFLLRVDVLAPVISGNAESKYICVADTITVTEGVKAFAPALPTPLVTTSVPYALGTTHTLSVPANVNTLNVSVQNIGGSHPETNVGLAWSIIRTGDQAFLFPVDPNETESRLQFGTEDVQTILYVVDRTGDPGLYRANLELTYSYNSIGIEIPIAPIEVSWSVGSPSVSVGQNTVDFGAASTVQTFTIFNGGQSTLDWSIDSAALPSWLSVDVDAGAAPFGEDPFEITLTASRAGLPAGFYTYDLVVSNLLNPADSEIITVQMTVP